MEGNGTATQPVAKHPGKIPCRKAVAKKEIVCQKSGLLANRVSGKMSETEFKKLIKKIMPKNKKALAELAKH